ALCKDVFPVRKNVRMLRTNVRTVRTNVRTVHTNVRTVRKTVRAERANVLAQRKNVPANRTNGLPKQKKTVLKLIKCVPLSARVNRTGTKSGFDAGNDFHLLVLRNMG